MKKITLIIILSTLIFAQVDTRDYNNRGEENPKVKKISGITDRAAGTHNASNIGLFFENRGKFYPRRLTQGPSGEFPINSGQHYIYHLNPFMGIKNNVVQGKFKRNEEFEAVGGYHNAANAKIAMSDDPTSWPETGWPVKDEFGNPIIKSFQDSYCVYNDELNSMSKLGIEVHQTGYAYGIDKFKNILFFKFTIYNKGNKDLEDFYFGMHTDLDVGNLVGGVPEYDDDRIGFSKEKNFLWFYDTDDRPGSEWPNPPGMMGITFLQTPKNKNGKTGITDMHWYISDSWNDVDSIEYGIMSSAYSFYQSSEGSKIFHPGANYPDLHYDDVNTLKTGEDVAAMVSWGPYDLKKDSSITIIIALLAGKDENELMEYWQAAYDVVWKYNFDLSKPPETPNLYAQAGDKKAILWWDKKADNSVDNFSKQRDFEGLRLYRSNDKGATWQLIFTCDKENYLGKDIGVQYAYVDSTVMNGFEYWYTLTAYDRGDGDVASLESPKGNTLQSPNTVSVIPRSEAIGRIATRPINLHKYTGKSTLLPQLIVKDDKALDGNEYEIKFTYFLENEIGVLKSYLSDLKVTDSNKTYPGKFAFYFTQNAPYEVDLINMYDDTKLKEGLGYVFGVKTKLVPGLDVTVKDLYGFSTPADSLPKKGDMFSINFGIMCIKNGSDTVLKPTLFNYERLYSTSDGIIIKFPEPRTNDLPIKINDKFKFKVIQAEVRNEEVRNNLSKIKVVPNPYIVSSLYEPDFGELSLEPLRRIQFINLPAECIIRIFTPAGDLVKTIYHNNLTGTENWDLRSDGGREIASGVYIYTVEGYGEKFTGRFAVIK